MDLARDLLDKPVKNEQGVRLGRVDSVVLDVHDGRPPRVVAIEIGPSALGDRVHPRLGRAIRRVEQWLQLGANRPLRIAVEHLRRDELYVIAAIPAAENSALSLERRLRRLFVWRPWK